MAQHKDITYTHWKCLLIVLRHLKHKYYILHVLNGSKFMRLGTSQFFPKCLSYAMRCFWGYLNWPPFPQPLDVPCLLEICHLGIPPIRDMDSHSLSSNGHWEFRTLVSSSLLFLLSHIWSRCKIFYLAVVVMALEPRATHLPSQMHLKHEYYIFLVLNGSKFMRLGTSQSFQKCLSYTYHKTLRMLWT